VVFFLEKCLVIGQIENWQDMEGPITELRRYLSLKGLMVFLLRILRFFVRFYRVCGVDSSKPEAMSKNAPRSLCFSYFVAVLTI
jgi:hypothetical protein